MQGRGEGEDAGSEEPRFLFDMGDEDQQRRAGPLPEQAGDPLPQGRIDAGEGFVEKEEIGVHGMRWRRGVSYRRSGRLADYAGRLRALLVPVFRRRGPGWPSVRPARPARHYRAPSSRVAGGLPGRRRRFFGPRGLRSAHAAAVPGRRADAAGWSCRIRTALTGRPHPDPGRPGRHPPESGGSRKQSPHG